MRGMMTMGTRIATAMALASALVLPTAIAGCGGESGGSAGHPADLEAADVQVPEDLGACMARMTELLEQLNDPLKVGKDLHEQRPIADEIAILADALSGVAAKGHTPQVVANVDSKGRGIAKEARRLAAALRKKDAATARAAHTATAGLVIRLSNELPKPKPEDE